LKEITLVLALLFVIITMTGKVNAQGSPQTYVAPSAGSDSRLNQPGQQSSKAIPNDCTSKVTPCKTITFALQQTRDGGKITLLEGGEVDAANTCTKSYDEVKVNKSVTIEGDVNLPTKPCFFANQTFQNGIYTVRSAPPNLIVNLRRLRFIGHGGFVGISFSGGSKLVVEDCYFDSLNHGIVFDVEGSLKVTGTKIHASTGIRLDPSPTRKTALISKSLFFGGNTSAIEVNGNGYATVEESDFSGGVQRAFLVNGTGSILVNGGTIDHVANVMKVSPTGSLEIKNTEIKNSTIKLK